MQLIIDPSGGRHIIVEHKGQQQHWKYSVWSKLKDQSTEEIFGATNEYLATLPEDTQKKMFDAFLKAYMASQEAMSEEDFRQVLFGSAGEAMQYLVEDDLYSWAKEHGKIYVAPTPPVRKSSNPAAMTYTPEESYDLSVFCIVVKILTPLLGFYVESITSVVSNTLKEDKASELFYATQLQTWRAFLRLNRYTEALAMRKMNLVSMAIRHGKPSADLNSYLMGHAIIRRLTVAKIRSDDDGSIVAFIYKFLEEKIIELTKSNYRDKLEASGGDSSESDSYSDNYRIPEEVDRGTVAIANLDLADIEKHCAFHEFSQEEYERVISYYNTLTANELFVPTNEIHYFVCGMVIRYYTYHQLVDKISLDTLLRTIAVAAVYCERRDLPEISNLILATRTAKDATKMTAGVQNGKTYAPLRRQDADSLKELFKHVPEGNLGRTNPGKEIIEKIVQIILAHDWPGMEEPVNIRKSLCDFFINREIRI